MPLARLPVPFDSPEWVYELKYDGFRALAYVAGSCQLISRKHNTYKPFGVLCEQVTAAIRQRRSWTAKSCTWTRRENRNSMRYSGGERLGSSWPPTYPGWTGRDLRRAPLLQ